MASEPVYMHHPDMITLRQAEARRGHIYWNRYDVAPTFRVSKRDTIAWATTQKAA